VDHPPSADRLCSGQHPTGDRKSPVLMKRRGFLALFGGGVAAAATKTAVALPAAEFVPVPSLVEVKPLLGELRYFYEAVPDSRYFSPAHGCHHPDVQWISRTVLQIFDGEQWVSDDSPQGVEAHNRALRFYQRTPTEGHQT
jgi:hypothetical protein